MAYTQQTPIGAPNADLITQTLAKLQPDSALQDYARMHKNDIYIVSLANAESNRRKALRLAAQGQNAGPQPTVVDQNIAGMAQTQLPENQGIAQIPTPNIQRMADGGIAGYEDDQEGMATGGMGGMFNFAQQSEPVIRMSGGGVPGYAAGVYNEERFKEFLKKAGKTSEFANASPSERQKILTEFADKTSGPQKAAAPTASTASTASVKAPAVPEDPRMLRKVSEAVGKGAGNIVKRAGPAGLAIQAGSNMGDYKLKDADNIDTSLMGTVRDVGKGEFGRAAKGLGLGLAELGMDAGSFGANMLDYVVPGKAPVSTAYEKLLKRNIDPGYTLEGPSDRAQPTQAKQPAAAPAPEVTPEAEAAAAAAAASKNVSNTGGVTDLLPSTAKLDTSYKPVAAPTIEDATTLGNKFTNLDARTNTINSQVAQKRSDITNAAENRIAALNAFNEKQGPAYAGYEKLLQKEELQDATDKDKAGLMSLMKGFLAMAAGESPNAATNIAKGAMVGMGDYGDALKEFKKSAKERNKEMQNIENARRAESRGNFDKAEMYEYQADQNRIAATDAGIAAISKVTDTSAAVSAGLYSDSLKLASDQNIAAMREAGANKRAVLEQSGANARALMPTGDARTAIMLGSGRTDAERLRSGMTILQELTADKSGAKTVETLAKINSDRAKNGEPPISMTDLVNSAREYSALMYPKVVNEAPTRAR